MRWKSTAARYGVVAISIHWATALAVFGLLASGLAMDRADEAARVGLLRGHVIVGSFVVLLTLLRIVWWLLADRRPAETSGQARWQALAAWAVHRAFYVVILVMGASGIALIALSGAVDVLFGGASDALPSFGQYPPRRAHGLGATLMMGLIALHVGAALYHQFILRERPFARIGLGRTSES